MKQNKPCDKKTDLSIEHLERAAQVLKTLAHPQRLKIVEIIEREGEATGSLLIERTGFPQPAISLHLNKMKQMNLLESKRNGREISYRICDTRVLSLLNCICSNQNQEI